MSPLSQQDEYQEGYCASIEDGRRKITIAKVRLHPTHT